MSNYDEMSDFEINKAVADCAGLFWHCPPSALQNDECVWIYSDNYCECDTNNGQVAVKLPDYCNSWSDMGPIIERENISLISNVSGEYAAVKNLEWFNGRSGGYCGDCDWRDKNPLRAAAIVYLMSKEPTK